MVKINWYEELAIDIIVAIIMIFLIRTYMDTTFWSVWIWILLLIVYFGVTSIIIKLIKGNEIIEKEKQERERKSEERQKKFSNWWRKQKTWEKIILILLAILIAIGILNL